MFAMFQCGRPDILPVGDLGVRKGFQTLYKLKACALHPVLVLTPNTAPKPRCDVEVCMQGRFLAMVCGGEDSACCWHAHASGQLE